MKPLIMTNDFANGPSHDIALELERPTDGQS
jgi:hypothetical protein